MAIKQISSTIDQRIDYEHEDTQLFDRTRDVYYYVEEDDIEVVGFLLDEIDEVISYNFDDNLFSEDQQ